MDATILEFQLGKKIAAILVAAGSGTRFADDLPKQYHLLAGKPVLLHSYQGLADHPDIGIVIVVIAEDAAHLFAQVFPKDPPEFVLGGTTRTRSVQAGLLALKEYNPDLVLIHDGARPFFATADIDAVLDGLQSADACAPALPIVDAIKQVDATNSQILQDANRDQFHRMQTPQGFQYPKFVQAMSQIKPHAQHDDDISVALAAGMKCTFVAGRPENLKITSKQDLQQTEQKMSQQSPISVSGTGFDVHRLGPGKGITLCGIVIPCEYSLIGHSDADVGLHAITDALLGAMALGDIGDHFPPTETRWKDRDSAFFLTEAARFAQQAGGQVQHVDVTLICEAPKIKPYRMDMRTRIAEILSLDLTQVSVKATTTEGLGFTGRGEGIAAQACVTLTRNNK